MFRNKIDRWTEEFEDIKELYSSNEMLPIYARKSVVGIIQRATPDYNLWKEIPYFDKKLLIELNALLTQMKDFVNELNAIIDNTNKPSI